MPIARSKRFFKKVKDPHRFHVDMFLSVIDRQLQELNDRFDEVNTDLLLCMSSFNPVDSFAAYDKNNLLRLAQFYPKDFSSTELMHLPFQCTHFIVDLFTGGPPRQSGPSPTMSGAGLGLEVRPGPKSRKKHF